MSTIWAFDLGKGSIGEAVWDEDQKKFLHVASLLIPAEFASTKDAASRRRMWRTRQAHKAREAWLDEVWTKAGLTPLVGRRVGKVDGEWKLIREGDEKLEREFSKPGDPTCYTSCLLRIKLLRGEKLEEWQIYKALHSAIQKRGYGRVPWAAREVGKKELTEEELAKELKKIDDELAKKDPDYKAAVDAWPKFKEEVPDQQFHFPCYYDAAKMGLWNPKSPRGLMERIDFDAESTRRVRFAREDVNREIAELARQAAEQLPSLAKAFRDWQKNGWKEFKVSAGDIGEFLVHGPAGKPSEQAEKDFTVYRNERKERGLHPGTSDDWMGATGQKTPRFDNRIINDCALLDGMQVCNVAIRYDDKKTHRIYPDSLLPTEVTFLMKLKNTRVEDGDGQRKLRVDEIRTIFEMASKEAGAVKRSLKSWAEAVANKYSIKGKDWETKTELKTLNLRPLAGHEVVKPPKTEGRSRFSRPALKLAKALILSGDKPSVFLKRLLDREQALMDEMDLDVRDVPPPIKAKGEKTVKHRAWVLPSQLKFLHDLADPKTDTWEAIYFPEQRLDALEARHRKEGDVDRDAAIREIIGDNNDPVVRHRLMVFAERLVALEEAHGAPRQIVLEFVREDFMGRKAKIALANFQSDREKARKEAREQAAAAGQDERSAPLKFELAKAQQFKCLYCTDKSSFGATSLHEYQIEHIVPRSQGGPDAMVNYVLSHTKCNDDKGEKTPFQWLHGREGWDAYVERVEKCGTALRGKKMQLLLREDAAELVTRYTALAETAWISRLAQKIASIRFGWRNGNDDDGDKRVRVVSGGLTARIRRKYKLNSILNPDAETEEEADKKNRDDDRHHALDAMVISLMPQWLRDPRKEKFFRLPDGMTREHFRDHIEKLMPRFICFEKPALAETIYGKQPWLGGKIVQRVVLRSIGQKSIAPGKTKYDPAYALKQTQAILDDRIKAMVREFLSAEPEEQAWNEFCDEVRLPVGEKGSRIIRVRMDIGKAEEFADLFRGQLDPKGQWRKAKKGHRGQVVYIDPDGHPKIRPVYVFESVATVRREIKQNGGKFYGFFRTGCLVSIEEPVQHDTTPLKAGVYRLNTIMKTGYMKVSDQSGKASLPINMEKFIEAKLKPIHALDALWALHDRKQQPARRGK